MHAKPNTTQLGIYIHACKIYRCACVCSNKMIPVWISLVATFDKLSGCLCNMPLGSSVPPMGIFVDGSPFGSLVPPMGIFMGSKPPWELFSINHQTRSHRGSRRSCCRGCYLICCHTRTVPWPSLLAPCPVLVRPLRARPWFMQIPSPAAEAVPLPAKLIVSRSLAALH